MTSIKVFNDPSSLANAAIDLFINRAQMAIEEKGVFSAVLSGGSTPRRLYTGLAASEQQQGLDWGNIHLFFGDERHVPPDHPESNFKMVQETLLSKIPIPQSCIHRVRAELDPRLAAFNYEDELRRFFEGEWPRFDLVFLGMGDDGHTASLFPSTAGLNEEHRWFVANYVPKLGEWRLTLTKNAINAACNIVVLVSGQSKAEMISTVLSEDASQKRKPIQLISPIDGEMVWMLDSEAASLLPEL